MVTQREDARRQPGEERIPQMPQQPRIPQQPQTPQTPQPQMPGGDTTPASAPGEETDLPGRIWIPPFP